MWLCVIEQVAVCRLGHKNDQLQMGEVKPLLRKKLIIKKKQRQYLSQEEMHLHTAA